MNKVIATLSLLLAFVGISQKAQAQQIINKYAALRDVDTCNNRFRFDDTKDFNAGDTILMIQMKTYGADTSSTPTFGDVVSYQSCGNYEYNIVKRKLPNNVLEFKYRFRRNYDYLLAPVQIVRVPYMQNFTVTGQYLTCAPWDPLAGKGGVLVVRVANTLTLDTNIDVSGRGFRGGAPLYMGPGPTPCNNTDYFYSSANNQGGQKGEGIGLISPLKNYGRGKITNGGGGGNNSKSGGGGGSNGGAGGGGGDQYQAELACANLIPGIGGIGGVALTYNNVLNKIFLGGGGGCGAGDVQGEIAGGNGGGIIILDAPTIIGNNKSVIADGSNAPECSGPGPGCQDDGGGGGGGGGTILINAPNVTNLLKVSAKGGKGADVYVFNPVNPTIETGPGGGGGGGVAWFQTTAVPAGVTVNTAPGANGVLPQFFNVPNGADVGLAGKTVNSLVFNFPTDTFRIKYDLNFLDSVLTCASRQFVNKTKVATGISIYSWWWSFGDGVVDTAKNPIHTYGAGGVYTVKLAAQDANTGCTDTISRDIVVANLTYDVSDTVLGCRTHQFLATKAIDSSIFPNAIKFEWAFGDGDSGIGNPIVHTYDTGGNYTVVLTVTDSSGCQDTTHFTAQVADAAAGFTQNDDTVCQGVSINFTDTSATTSIFWAWNFDDGTGPDSTQNPIHIYPNQGSYNVRLIVGNITGCLDTAYHLSVVDSISPVNYIPSDTVLCEGQTIVLNGYYIHDNALRADWDLGDGFTAIDTDPVTHAYDTAGNYNVTLTVHFRACPDITFAKQIAINPFPTLNLGPDTSMCPNGPAIVLADNINVSNPIARWAWNTGDSANSISVTHPGIYSAMVNVNGCITNDSVEVFKDCYIDIPNAFSPNNDGSNDYFLPRQLLSSNVVKFNMTIYNRWGQEIFHTTSIDGRGWDGKFNGKDQPLGVYVYRIDATFASGASESYTGNLTLLR